MKTLPKIAVILCAAGVVGCGSVSSTVKRSGVTGLSALAGGGAAYELSHHNATVAVAGAVAGATLAQLAEGEDTHVRQAGFDEGYLHGQSDAIKREYFLRHAREAEPRSKSDGETVYYLMPGPEVTVDGRKLEPHQVAIRVVE
jgi:hypothetical protein